MKKNKSRGYDKINITNISIPRTPSVLLKLYNACVKNLITHDQWKKANTTTQER